MAKKKLPIAHETTVSGAMDDAYSVCQGLRDELQDWYDNLPENFQSGSKGDELQEAIDGLDNAEEVDVPAFLADLPVLWHSVPSSSHSRRQQRDDALEGVYAALDVVEDWLGENLELEESEATDDNPEVTEAMVADRDDEISEATELRDNIQAFIDAAEDVSFPGMR